MRDREAAGLVAAGLCISVALLRMIAPALPFDWMTLALVLGAAVLLWLPYVPKGQGGKPKPRKQPDPQAAQAEPFIPRELDALSARMAQTGWQAREGGLFDALRKLSEGKPFAAVCAARGMLAMLLAQTEVPAAESATLSLLVAAMDAMAAAGEVAADANSTGTLFDYALRALGYLEGLN